MKKQFSVVNRKRTAAGIFCLLILLAGVFSTMVSAKQQEETVVRVGFYNSVFNYMNDAGKMTGYGYDYQQKIAEYTGWKYEYVEGSWTELMDMIAAGEIDLLADVSYLPEREETMLYSSVPMGEEHYYLYTAQNSRITADDRSALNGSRIGVTTNSFEESLLRSWLSVQGLNAQIIQIDSDTEMAQQLESGSVEAIVAGDAFHEFAECTPVLVIGSSDVFFAISKKCSELKEELDAAMGQILSDYPNYHDTLYQKYQITEIKRNVTAEEAQWLEGHGAIRVGYRDNYLAFSGTKENGELDGALADILTEGTRVIGNTEIAFDAIAYSTTQDALDALYAGEVDCVFPVNMGKYEAEQRNLFITTDLVSVGTYAAVRKEKFSGGENTVVAVNSGNPNYYSFLAMNYPSWKTREYENTEACFAAIEAGEADCIFLTTYRVSNVEESIEKHGLTSIYMDSEMSMSMAVRREDRVLLSILDRMISLIPRSIAISSLAEHSYVERNVTFHDFLVDNLRSVLISISVIMVIIIALLIRSIISARRARTMEKKLEISMEAAKAANRAKTLFLNNMSHDIRTPMNAILGFTHLIEKYPDEREKVLNYAEKIEASGDYLLSLINNVLDVARIESGKVELNETAFDLRNMDAGMTSLFEEEVRKKKLKYSSNVDFHHPYVWMDVFKVQQIGMNIISNAIKYTPEGGEIRIDFREIPCEKEGYATYQVTVKDTGIGMNKEYLENIFDPFSRERTTTESKIIGTGLGMSIVKKLVDLMDGTIDVESEPGKGSTFRVVLTHRLADEPIADQADALRENQISFEGMRVLLAEDNDLNAEIAEEILSEFGITVERAEDGAECVSMLTEQAAGYYDLILMDIQMPKMNGYDATRTIRKLPDLARANIPIVAMTANAFESDRQLAFDAGMNGHVAKPINVTTLMETIAALAR